MTPGRELDALIAAKIMDLRPITRAGGGPPEMAVKNGAVFIRDGFVEIPHYSTSIADAWEVVQKIEEMGMFWWMSSSEGGPISAHVRRLIHAQTIGDGWVSPRGVSPIQLAESTAHSICLAALKAVDVEFDKILDGIVRDYPETLKKLGD